MLKPPQFDLPKAFLFRNDPVPGKAVRPCCMNRASASCVVFCVACHSCCPLTHQHHHHHPPDHNRDDIHQTKRQQNEHYRKEGRQEKKSIRKIMIKNWHEYSFWRAFIRRSTSSSVSECECVGKVVYYQSDWYTHKHVTTFSTSTTNNKKLGKGGGQDRWVVKPLYLLLVGSTPPRRRGRR